MTLRRRDVTVALLATPIARGASSLKVAVVGAGVFGAWTAYSLLQSGASVTLIDAYGAGNSRSSSGGETRIIRMAYGPDAIYTRFALRALGLWKEFFAEHGYPYFRPDGVLWMAKRDNPYARASMGVMREAGVRFDVLSPSELRRRYAQIQVAEDTGAIYESESGALMARSAVEAVAEQFVKRGGRFVNALVRPPAGKGKLDAVRTASGESIPADAFVFACGPWLPKVFPELLGNRIFPTRQEVIFFGPPAGDESFSPPKMPVWIDFSDNLGFYGFPNIDNRGFKVAFDKHGPPADPDNMERILGEDKLREARRYVAQRFPALRNAPVIESRICQYENTSNGDFLIDRHPSWDNVWLVGGGSGHGFKHGPAVGEYASERVLKGGTIDQRFSLATKNIRQNRAVY